MQRAEGHTGRKRISPATLEMFARERDRGRILQQLGWMIGVSPLVSNKGNGTMII